MVNGRNGSEGSPRGAMLAWRTDSGDSANGSNRPGRSRSTFAAE